MAILETVKIISDTKSGYMIINKTDIKATHRLFIEVKPVEPTISGDIVSPQILPETDKPKPKVKPTKKVKPIKKKLIKPRKITPKRLI